MSLQADACYAQANGPTKWVNREISVDYTLDIGLKKQITIEVIHGDGLMHRVIPGEAGGKSEALAKFGACVAFHGKLRLQSKWLASRSSLRRVGQMRRVTSFSNHHVNSE
jgi:hypothetical protein